VKLLDDLFKDADGAWSGAKMAAAWAHASMAIMFAKLSLEHGFLPDMWTLYGGLTILHATYDKTAAQVQAFKEKVLAATTQGPTDAVSPPSPPGPV
jgi:hypothetical protein